MSLQQCIDLLLGVHVDSLENMAKLVELYVKLSTYVDDIVYLWRLFRSPENWNFWGLESCNGNFSIIVLQYNYHHLCRYVFFLFSFLCIPTLLLGQSTMFPLNVRYYRQQTVFDIEQRTNTLASTNRMDTFTQQHINNNSLVSSFTGIVNMKYSYTCT